LKVLPRGRNDLGNRIWKGLAIVLLVVLAAGCAPAASPPIQVTGAWVRATNFYVASSGAATLAPTDPMPGMAMATSAVYLTLENRGDQPDRLVSVYCDVAQTVEIHQSQVVGGIASMERLDSLALPAHNTIQFQPGGYHLMLVGLKRDLIQGESFSLDLQFEKAGTVLVQAIVRGP